MLPPQYLQVGVLLIHPYLVLERTARDLTTSLRQFMAGKRPALTDEQRNAVVLTDAQKRSYLAFWREYTGMAETLGDAPSRRSNASSTTSWPKAVAWFWSTCRSLIGMLGARSSRQTTGATWTSCCPNCRTVPGSRF